ncbi:ABC transporter substrate-binding protein [Lampropedia puyangensis]|uniref:ABC transporter substrate-binding protein n=1 Tax=Lampropedia puyangensis TaxID=1330072 RepID=A0A4S8F7W2_9BURK|nr:ABC transporter substrate-binding protein [Lampropedia puyangensis]THU01472.1 ABC transporter substrate-binding protein [Lampropedia puyangensis]
MLTHKINQWLTAAFFSGCAFVLSMPGSARAQDMAPNEMVEKVTTDVLKEIHDNNNVRSGNIDAAREAVDRLVMPHINFSRMTAAAVGPAWRNATAEQRTQVVNEFKAMLIRTYAGSLDQIGDLKVVVLPMRAQPDDSDVLVRSEVRGGDQPIKLDYRLQKTPGQGLGWKVYNVNVMGAWIVDSYRSQFQPIVNSSGIDGLIESLRKGEAK